MMKKLLVLASGGVGYVLGARAGRERYEEIRRWAGQVKDDPRVQEKAHEAADLAREKAPEMKDKVSEKMHRSGQDDLERELHPDNVALQEDPYPKGDLP